MAELALSGSNACSDPQLVETESVAVVSSAMSIKPSSKLVDRRWHKQAQCGAARRFSSF